MAETILITQPEFNKAEAIFRAASDVSCESAPTEEQVLAELIVARGVRIAVVGVAPYRGPLYEALGKQGRRTLIARCGVGHDGLHGAGKILKHKQRVGAGIAVVDSVFRAAATDGIEHYDEAASHGLFPIARRRRSYRRRWRKPP